MVTRFPLRLASSVTDGKVSMACQGVSRVLCCRFGVTSSNSCRPFVSIGRHFTDPHEASSTRLWQHFLGAWQAEQSTNTASFSYTTHFYLFELIYYVVKAILLVESQRATADYEDLA